MSVATPQHGGYSADVQMHLSVNGHTFSIGQLGPDFIILDDPIDHPPADGEIAFSIDGRVRRWRVQLPEGISKGSPRTRIADWMQANGSRVVIARASGPG
jgi:hypothetical protein